MTAAEMKAFIIKQIAYYKSAIEYDTREIEYLNNIIKHERTESKKVVAYVWGYGVLKKYEMEIYTPDYKTPKLRKAERDRARAYRDRKRHTMYLYKYENELKQYEPKPAEEPQPEPQETETTARKTISGTIASTGERCEMRANGYWTSNGKHITSYKRIDKPTEYNEDGAPVVRQYSMDRQRRFYIETEEEI